MNIHWAGNMQKLKPNGGVSNKCLYSCNRPTEDETCVTQSVGLEQVKPISLNTDYGYHFDLHMSG